MAEQIRAESRGAGTSHSLLLCVILERHAVGQCMWSEPAPLDQEITQARWGARRATRTLFRQRRLYVRLGQEPLLNEIRSQLSRLRRRWGYVRADRGEALMQTDGFQGRVGLGGMGIERESPLQTGALL